MEVRIDNKAHTLIYDEQRQTVRHVIKGFNKEDEWKSLLSTGIDILKEKGINRWLSDNRLNTVHPPGVNEWIEKEWVPAAIEAGWSKWALVEAEKALGKISERKFIDLFKELGVEVRLFSSVEEAEAWIG